MKKKNHCIPPSVQMIRKAAGDCTSRQQVMFLTYLSSQHENKALQVMLTENYRDASYSADRLSQLSAFVLKALQGK